MKSALMTAGFLGVATLAGAKVASVMDVSFQDVGAAAGQVWQIAAAATEDDKKTKADKSEKSGEEAGGEREEKVEEVKAALLAEILIDVAAERSSLKSQAFEIEKTEAEMLLARQALAAQHEKLMILRNEIDKLLVNAEENHVDDIERLVKMYIAMKPPQAADIMNDLDIAVAVLVLATMPERNSGPILAEMDSVRARAISKIIFERSRLPGDQDLGAVRLR